MNPVSCYKMENQFNSPTSSIASIKDNKWMGEYVDNSPDCNPISYDFLPQSGSPKGDETPVAKKKRTSLKSFENLGPSPITTRVQQRLLPPPPSERLEDLKKFTNIYKELFSGNGDSDADEQSESESISHTVSDFVNTPESLEKITNESNGSSLTNKVPAVEARRTNSVVNNEVTVSKQRQSSSPDLWSPSQNSSTKTPKRKVEDKSSERSRTNLHMGSRGSASKRRENNRLVNAGANRKSRGETSNPKLDENSDEVNISEENDSIFDWLDDLLSNEILLLHDGNDDGFSCIDDTTLLYLCSGSQTTNTQIPNVQEEKCEINSSKISVTTSIPAKRLPQVSAANNNCSSKISVSNKFSTKVSVPSKCTAQEIEKKRREAMKKLLERRRINSQKVS